MASGEAKEERLEALIDLRGRSAVVTGASRGVGRATALLLARAGCSVGMGFRTREEEARSVVAEIQALVAEAVAVHERGLRDRCTHLLLR